MSHATISFELRLAGHEQLPSLLSTALKQADRSHHVVMLHSANHSTVINGRDFTVAPIISPGVLSMRQESWPAASSRLLPESDAKTQFH